eukprot:6183406-Pleurochrysis_carterae.AAC.2
MKIATVCHGCVCLHALRADLMTDRYRDEVLKLQEIIKGCARPLRCNVDTGLSDSSTVDVQAQ